MKDEERISGFLLGVIVGGLIGSITTLLYAPTSGKKMRKKISSRAEDILDDAQDYIETGKDKAEEIYKEGKKKVTDIVEDAKKIIKS